MLLAALPLVACHEAPSGPCGGVWLARAPLPAVPAAPLRGDEQLGFDIRDGADGIAVYPLWDTSRPKLPARSPWRIDLTRSGDAAVGTISYRLDAGDHTCTVKQPARLSGCPTREAVLDLTLAEGIDPSSCAVAAPPARLAFTLARR